MPQRSIAGLLGCLCLLALAGCSSRVLYESVQGWQQQECHKLRDAAERQRCLKSSATSWDDYQRQRDAARGGSR